MLVIAGGLLQRTTRGPSEDPALASLEHTFVGLLASEDQDTREQAVLCLGESRLRGGVRGEPGRAALFSSLTALVAFHPPPPQARTPPPLTPPHTHLTSPLQGRLTLLDETLALKYLPVWLRIAKNDGGVEAVEVCVAAFQAIVDTALIFDG